jgi:hypothetical protein
MCSNITSKSILYLTNLQTLYLDFNLNTFSTLIMLENLECDNITFTQINEISTLPNLKILKLNECPQLLDENLILLGKSKKLIELNIETCFNITDIGIYHLTNLKHLYLGGNNNITENSIVKMIYLDMLSIHHTFKISYNCINILKNRGVLIKDYN